MLYHPTLDKLKMLKFSGMSRALEEQMQSPDITQLSFEERLGLLVDREITERDNRRLTSRLRRKLRCWATPFPARPTPTPARPRYALRFSGSQPPPSSPI